MTDWLKLSEPTQGARRPIGWREGVLDDKKMEAFTGGAVIAVAQDKMEKQRPPFTYAACNSKLNLVLLFNKTVSKLVHPILFKLV